MEKVQRPLAKKNVFWLGLTSFFTDVSSEMIFAVLPLFLKNVLAAPFIVIGLIDGIADGISAFLKYISGWFSDRIQKRKPLAFLGYTFSTISKIFLFLAFSWPVVLVLRVLDRIGKGIRTAPRDALIAESVSENERGKYFGFHRALDSAGAFLGTGIVVLIFYLTFSHLLLPQEKTAETIRTIFLFAFIPALLALFPFLFVKDLKIKEKSEEKFEKISKLKLFSFKCFSFQFYFVVFILSIFSLGNISYAFFILKSQEIGIAIFMLPLLYLVYNFFYSLFSYPAGKLSDKIGKSKVLTIGFLIMALVLLGTGINQSKVLIWLLFLLYGFGIGIVDGVSKAFLSDFTQTENRGSAFGFYYMISGLMTILGNLLFGFLWDNSGGAIPFLLAGLLVMTAMIFLIIFNVKYRGVLAINPSK